MDKKDINLEGERIRFSKRIKRKILLEIAKGENPKEVLSKYIFLPLEQITSDKKYIAKLLHKWRKELYENKEMLCLINYKPDKEILLEEIENIGNDFEDDFEFDNAFEELKNNFLKIVR